MSIGKCCLLLSVCALFGAHAVSAEEKDAAALKEESALLKNWEELKKRNLDLVPVPKNISFDGGEIIISGEGAKDIAIVLPQKTEKGVIAANEIISRIKELAPGKEIPVLSEPRKGAFNIIIENTWPNSLTKDESRPADVKGTDQAYTIQLCPEGLKLAGEGEMGMLYAAVTTRFLIAQKDGKVVLYPAAVLDWPDFKLRFAGTICHIARAKKTDYIDWLFHLKINGIFRHTIGSMSQSSVPGEINPKNKSVIQEEQELNRYAGLRGIGNVQAEKVSLGKYPEDKDRPGFDKMLFHKGSKRYFCWSRHDLHEIKADNVAGFCRETGTKFIYVHARDGGGYHNPEHWEERCALCREKYGDDRASADADMFNIYADALKKDSGNSEMLAVVYPYAAGFFDRETLKKAMVYSGITGADVEDRARLISQKLQSWMRDLDQKLRPGVRICVREDSRKNLMQFYDGFKGRAFFIYWSVAGDRSLLPILPDKMRCLNTAYAPERKQASEDIIWANDGAYSFMFPEPVRVCLAEYSWNTRFPGCSGDYNSSCEPKFLEIDDQKALDIMAGRAAAGLFGGAAAKHGKELFGHYLSFKLAGTPGDTISELRLSPQETLALLKRNKMAAEKASAALAALWEDVKNAKKHNKKFMSDFAYPFFIEMLRVVNAAKLCSDINLGEFQARDCVKNGNVTKALGIIKETEALLAAGRREYERIAAETKDEPGLKDYIKDYDKLMEKSYKHRNGSGLLNPDFKSLESRLSNLRENYPDIYAKHNISCDFKKWFASREITARKMKSPAAPDGYPDGGDWKNAPPLEYFASGDFVLSPEPLFLRFLYDDKNLYINGKVFSAEDSSAGGPLDIFITRADKTAPEVYRLSVGAGGELTCGVKKSFAEDAPFQSWRSGAKAAVTKDKDGWAFKIAAPLEELAPADSRGKTFCKVNYTRKSDDKGADAEVYSSAVSGGKKSGPPEGYSKLVFAPEASAPNPSVTIELDENKTGISTRAHETGVGSLVTFNFGVRTDRVLRNAVISGSITDDKGGTLATVQTIEKPLAQSLWTNDEPCQIQLDDTHDNIRIRLRLEAETLEGEKTEKTKVFKVGHEKPNPENSLPLPGVWKCAPDPGDKGRGKAWFAPGFDDRSWKKVSILKSLEKQGIKDYTYAWYRTSSVIPEKYKNKKVYLMLGAVDDTCWVWINGRAAGEYLYDPVNRPHSWREPLYFDISGLVDFGGDNQITALVRKKDGQHGGIWSASYLLFED